MANGDELNAAKTYSCTTCRQRKVKCDRVNPCSNCVKAGGQCSYVAPVRGKRKRTKPIKEGLHAKLARYEELLKSHGTKAEVSDDSDDMESTSTFQEDVTMRAGSLSGPSKEAEKVIITEEGSSRYFDSALWSNIGESQHPELSDTRERTECGTGDDTLLLDTGTSQDLARIHPTTQIVVKLFEVFADRVDALMKILHLPTFKASVLEGIKQPQKLSKSFEALMMSFYLVTTSALEEEECQRIFGTEVSVMCNRFKHATRNALMNAGILSTSSPTTLCAFAIYMNYIRRSTPVDALYVMSGITIRLARMMGLHRDGLSLGLSPFDTEMRRRLWWQLASIDARIAEIMGVIPSLDLSQGDTKIPLNVEDEDLSPSMTNFPSERNGITQITMLRVRCELIEIVRKYSDAVHGDVFTCQTVSLEKKAEIIAEIEDHFGSTVLRYCDFADPLHTFISIMVRSSICRMKLAAYNPRQFVNGDSISSRERNIVFENATKLLDYVVMLQGGGNGLEKFTWTVGTTYIWNSMLYLLIEIRRRRMGTELDKSWQLIGKVFAYNPQVFDENPPTAFKALGRWTMETWNEYVNASKEDGLEPNEPEYISKLRRFHSSRFKKPAKDSNQDMVNGEQPQVYEDLPGLDMFGDLDFSDLLSFESDPNEWLQWEQLLTEQSGIAMSKK